MSESHDSGGGPPPAGRTKLHPSTMHAVRRLTPEQIEAYRRAAELVRRWEEKDSQDT